MYNVVVVILIMAIDEHMVFPHHESDVLLKISKKHFFKVSKRCWNCLNNYKKCVKSPESALMLMTIQKTSQKLQKYVQKFRKFEEEENRKMFFSKIQAKLAWFFYFLQDQWGVVEVADTKGLKQMPTI